MIEKPGRVSTAGLSLCLWNLPRGSSARILVRAIMRMIGGVMSGAFA